LSIKSRGIRNNPSYSSKEIFIFKMPRNNYNKYSTTLAETWLEHNFVEEDQRKLQATIRKKVRRGIFENTITELQTRFDEAKVKHDIDQQRLILHIIKDKLLLKDHTKNLEVEDKLLMAEVTVDIVEIDIKRLSERKENKIAYMEPILRDILFILYQSNQLSLKWSKPHETLRDVFEDLMRTHLEESPKSGCDINQRTAEIKRRILKISESSEQLTRIAKTLEKQQETIDEEKSCLASIFKEFAEDAVEIEKSNITRPPISIHKK
jgi:hypothetical protein